MIRQYLMKMISSIIKKGCKRDKVTHSKTLQSRIPTSDAELRNLYLVGKHSIIMNLPRLNVDLIDDHSYVLDRKCISRFLSEGNMPHFILGNNIPNPVFLTKKSCKRIDYENTCSTLHYSFERCECIIGYAME